MDKIFGLRTRPTQFTSGKTEATLIDLSKRYLEKTINSQDDRHLLDIVVTNNSLEETQQWKFRTLKRFQGDNKINIHILSSKSEDFTTLSSYIDWIEERRSVEELPNILIICFHEKRVCDDLIRLFNKMGGHNPMMRPTKLFKFHISFDEIDANIGVAKKFLTKIKDNNFIENNTIIGILFITATPEAKFWKMIHKKGIQTLLNIDYNNTYNFDDELKKYRSFNDHEIICHNYDTNNPLEYIKDVFYNTSLISNETRNIIFAPAHTYTETKDVGSHKEFVSFFRSMNYCVLLLNSKFKGFIYPDGTLISISTFNQDNNIEGELRVTLSKWNELNPTVNLLITGNNIIERGLTFNTLGFNFTHMILSLYHLASIAKLIQMAGRASGGIQYVDLIKVICPSIIAETITDFNEKMNEICSLNPEHFNQTDFEINNNNTIPVKLEVIDDELLQLIIYACIPTKLNKKQKLYLHNILKNGISDGKIILHDRNNVKKFDISQRTLNVRRMYVAGQKDEVRRFITLNKNYENCTTMGQSGNETQYSIDFAKDEYNHGGYNQPLNIIWVTYKY
jgi:hypothetical protein